MTEEAYWRIWDNITEVRFSSPSDETDIEDEEPWERQDRRMVENSTDRMTSDITDDSEIIVLFDETDKEYNEGYLGYDGRGNLYRELPTETDQWESLDIWSKEL